MSGSKSDKGIRLVENVVNVLIAEPVRIVAEDIGAEVLGICEDATVRYIVPHEAEAIEGADLLIWGWDLTAAEHLQGFRSLAARARHVIVTAASDRFDWDFPVEHLPFPVRPEQFREAIATALGRL